MSISPQPNPQIIAAFFFFFFPQKSNASFTNAASWLISGFLDFCSFCCFPVALLNLRVVWCIDPAVPTTVLAFCLLLYQVTEPVQFISYF